jgi:DNA-binding GntR family transcriptional regulator
MRGPTREEILQTPPPGLRMKTKITQAYLDLRMKILVGEYLAGQVLTTKRVEDEYGLNNVATQSVLLRLAAEGLVRVLPALEKTWPNNAAINEYRVADLSTRQRMDSTRRGDFVADISRGGYPAYKEIVVLKVQNADAEVAQLLGIAEGEPVIYHRNLQRRDADTIVCINDQYLPLWFAPMMPELEKPDCDVYQLMQRLGRKPFWCKEAVEVVQASSVERSTFGMSPDDPSALLKILRRSFDEEGAPLEVQFLTDRGDTYRLHYSFPLFDAGVPAPVRER